jgi:PAS domain S-box-containing protein
MQNSSGPTSSQPSAEILIYQNRILTAILSLKKLQIKCDNLEETTALIAEILFEKLGAPFVGFAFCFDSKSESEIYCYTPSGQSNSEKFEKLAKQSLLADTTSLGNLCLEKHTRGLVFIEGFETPSSDDCPLLNDLLAEISRNLCLGDRQQDNVSSSFFESNYAMMLLVDPATASIVDANPAAIKYYGWSREEMRGKPVSELNTLSPREIEVAMKDAVDEKRNLFHFQHRRADGSVCDVDILSGKILYRGKQLLYSIVHDAGKRRTVEENLAQERQRLQFILEAAEYGTWEWDILAHKARINDTLAQMLGYSLDDLKPVNIDLLRAHFHPEDFQKSEPLLKDCLSKVNRLFESEIRMKHKDGHWVWTLARGRVVTRDRNDEPLQMFGTLTSIQSRKSREAEREVLREQLTQSQKMESVGRLAGGIAHDFNNLLTVILGHAESALADLGNEHPVACDLREIGDAAQRSAMLTRQLLAFARRQPATPQLISLDDTIDSLLCTLKDNIRDKVTLNWSPGVDDMLVRLDPLQVNQMIEHLVSNANDAVSENGVINLATTVETIRSNSGSKEKPGDYVVVSVSDNGAGMSETTLARLYEPFFTTKEVGKGTGLGLSTVDGIVNQNQGFIRVQSRIDEGTEFQVFFPIVVGEKPATATNPAKARKSDCTETVLIVEDEPSVLLLAERILTRRGYRVLSAGLPETAIEIFKANKDEIDLLFTDVMMPGMNGPEMAKIILGESPDLKCLYMSGYSAETIAERGLLDETVQILEKPFCANGLAEKVREVLDS